jgi:hypothetical protein
MSSFDNFGEVSSEGTSIDLDSDFFASELLRETSGEDWQFRYRNNKKKTLCDILGKPLLIVKISVCINLSNRICCPKYKNPDKSHLSSPIFQGNPLDSIIL